MEAAQLQGRRKDAGRWLGYKVILTQSWIPGDQVFPPACCRDLVNRRRAMVSLSHRDLPASRWRVYHENQVVLTVSVLPYQPSTVTPADLTSDGWKRARQGDEFLRWLYRRGPGRPPLEADPDAHWRRVVQKAEAYKRQHPRLSWAQVAANIGEEHETLRKWRRRAQRLEDGA